MIVYIYHYIGSMNTQKQKKLNPLLTQWKRGAVYTQTWLSELGYNHDLVKAYRRSGWIESIGVGAYKLSGDTVDWLGGLYALQKQKKLAVHPGGRTALELKGYAHYARPGRNKCFLFAPSGTALPKWFLNYDWNADLIFKATNLFPANMEAGFTEYPHKEINIRISAPERAAMEMLYYVPSLQGFDEAYHILEGLLSLRPELVQELLEKCASVKVKRLFLYMSEKAELPWFNLLNIERIHLGSGKRFVVPNGVFDKKYQITVSK